MSMSDNRSKLIENLNKLLINTDDNIKRTAGLVLALLETDSTVNTIEDLRKKFPKLINFVPTTGRNPLSYELQQSLIKRWLGEGLIDKGIFNINGNNKDNADTYHLNMVSTIITGCVNGNVSSEVCKSTLENLGDNLSGQMLNLKLTLSTLRALGFKIYKENNVLIAGTQNQHLVQSLEEWEKENKDKLHTQLNPKLKKVLETLVLTANAYANKWDSTQPVPVVLSSRKQELQSDENQPQLVLGVVSHIGGLTEFQKYYSGLLPIKAKSLGIQLGGGLVSYNSDNKTGVYSSYVDEQVDTNGKHFITGKVLSNLLDQMLVNLKAKGIKTESINEITNVKTQLKELQDDEITLINLTSIIEKYLALIKYFNVKDKPVNMEQIAKLIETHSDKFKRVEQRRNGLGKILIALASPF